MRFKRVILFFVFVLKLDTSFAQSKKDIPLIFQPEIGSYKLIPGETFYKLNNGDSLQIGTLKFYISSIELLNAGKIVWKEKNSFHLLDASVNQSLNLSLNTSEKINFDQIKFNLGIDSITNVSGAMGGDLDPTRGMYWTWQSGYINFKLEGKSKKCNTRNNEFQFHLGGYQQPFYALQTIELDANPNEPLLVYLDIEKLISEIDLSKQDHIMSPSIEAVALSKVVSKSFSLKKK